MCAALVSPSMEPAFIPDPIVKDIESYCMNMIRQLFPLPGEGAPQLPSVHVPRLSSSGNVAFSDDTGVVTIVDEENESLVTMNKLQAVHFTRLVAVLATIHHLSLIRKTMTKRALYYTDVELFGDQAGSDSVIEEVGRLLRLPRHALAITNARKGIFTVGFTSITLFFRDQNGTVNETVCSGQASNVPQFPELLENIVIQGSEPQWVLVVEKEAVFSRLLEDKAQVGWESEGVGPGIIVTGRGYPDVSTRLFLRKLSSFFPHIPVCILVDHDPHGLQIASTYAHGSIARASEASLLALPSIHLAGILARDLQSLPSGAGLALTKQQQHLAELMLQREPFVSIQPFWRSELQTMIDNQQCCEIESFYSRGLDYLATQWLPGRLREILLSVPQVQVTWILALT